jgi:hypothetical protein
MNRPDYNFDFRDPYTVEGAERAKRFAHNFNAQQLFGPPGFLEQCAIVREADRSLLPEHLKVFCAKIGHAPSSRTFKTLRELGERYHRWEAAFGSASSSVALLQIIASSPDTFELTIFQGENVIYMDADELRECIVESEVCTDIRQE